MAVDYPGFGLSTAPPDYEFTPAEHAEVIEDLVVSLDLHDITLVVHDWGGPIGFAVATRHPERFTRLVIGNTFAWPKSDPLTQIFSRTFGGPIGGWLIVKRNFFVETILPTNLRAKALPNAVREAYRGPFPTPQSRKPIHAFPRQILASRPFLAQIERDLALLQNRPTLIVWPTHDIAFRKRERRRWEQLFPDHKTINLEGAGHFIQEDAAAEIVAAIRDWHPSR